jgi:methylenetetrahydrofolate--tRNA-(uracil-5-)-methyltransferase
MSGVEGYVESAASGLIAGRSAVAIARGRTPSVPPRTTAIGALGYYVSHAAPRDYQPSNITWGILEALEHAPRDRAMRKQMMADRAMSSLEQWIQSQERTLPADALPEPLPR